VRNLPIGSSLTIRVDDKDDVTNRLEQHLLIPEMLDLLAILTTHHLPPRLCLVLS
jgi:hypothetical protein